MNYHCFLSLQVFESPYFSTLPRSVLPAGSLALSRLFLFSSAGTRSAPHSHALFAASGARAAADIIAIFFYTPTPFTQKHKSPRQHHAAPFTVPSRRRSQHLVPFREETSADKPLHIDPQLAPVPATGSRRSSGTRCAWLFFFCSAWTTAGFSPTSPNVRPLIYNASAP